VSVVEDACHAIDVQGSALATRKRLEALSIPLISSASIRGG
jgi:hypothetical protein